MTAAEAEQALQDHGPLTAAELARATPALRDEQTLQRALTELVRHHDTGLPVVSAPTATGCWAGWTTATSCAPWPPPPIPAWKTAALADNPNRGNARAQAHDANP